MTRILCVCLGNICRSPAAEAAIREAAAEAGVEVDVDSAGTGAYHVGEPPHPRIRAAGRTAGLAIDGRARQVRPGELASYDVVVAMDRANLDDLRSIQPALAERIHLLLSFDPDATDLEVPDPYGGSDDDYRHVVELVRPAARGLIAAIREGRL
jgi:protein-tyrosine phosphatase